MSQFSNFNLPYGAQIGGAIVLPAMAGKVFYVGSAVAGAKDTPSQGASADAPLDTIDYAIGLCVASRGDIIYVLPGHIETIAVAGGITCDIAGVSIIGLGNGADRPLIKWSATDSTWAISAANVTIQNIRTTNTIDEVVSMFNITGADCTLDGVDFINTTGQAIQFLTASTAADRLIVKNCFHVQTAAANSAQVWFGLSALDDCRIMDNVIFITANASTGSIAISGAIVRGFILRNVISWQGGTITKIIDTGAGTGIIAGNWLFGGAQTLAAAAVTSTGCAKIENYWTLSATLSGVLSPASA